MIEWNKKSGTVSKTTSDHIREMEADVDDFCERLSKDSKEFDAKTFFDVLHKYIVNDGRLLYTNITNYVFSLEKEEKFGIMQTNLDKVINYMYSEQFSEDYVWKPSKDHEISPFNRTKQTVLKMWDHMNLARRQLTLFHETDADYERIVEKKMEIVSASLLKEMNGQLLALVAIFTALSFLVFGGISSLDNIFIGAKDIPVTKLMIVGTIWCFCIMNLVFMFMFFIAKLTKLDIKSSRDINANSVQKYPLVWWCNLVLIAILLISCWAYYIKCEGFSKNAYSFLSQHSTAYFIIGTLAIIGLIISAVIKIYKMSKDEIDDLPNNEHYS